MYLLDPWAGSAPHTGTMAEAVEQFYLAAPLAVVLLSFSIAFAVVLATDGLAMPRPARDRFAIERAPARQIADIALRLPAMLFVYVFFFAISWRPVYACLAVISFFVIFTLISRVKFRFIREPLIFSDLALVVDVFRYKEIFYASWLNIAFWAFAILYVFGLSALIMALEPTLLPAGNAVPAALAGLVVWFSPLVLLTVQPVRALVSQFLRTFIGRLDLRANTIRFGTFGYIVLNFLMWIGNIRDKRTFIDEARKSLDSAANTLVRFRKEEAAPLVVVWQSESFVDMRHFGLDGLSLPHLDTLRERAAQWGRLANVFEGGYTLRTEFAVLSGIQPESIDLDASYPYLRAGEYADLVWPMRLKKAGWRTHFVHPYERTFFMRHKAIPQLGFDRMTMLDAFDHRPKPSAPYVPDMTLAHRVCNICEEYPEDRGAFVFVASMENHGPWQRGRCGNLSDPVDIYCRLLERSDAALGHLVGELNEMDRPVWLVFYGDHAPLLKAFADPFPDPRTDYLIAPLGKGRRTSGASQADLEPWNLLGSLAARAGIMNGGREGASSGWLPHLDASNAWT